MADVLLQAQRKRQRLFWHQASPPSSRILCLKLASPLFQLAAASSSSLIPVPVPVVSVPPVLPYALGRIFLPLLVLFS